MWRLRVERDGWQVEAAIAKGREPPEWSTDEPQAIPDEEWWFRAFWDLSTCRAATGFGLSPIPWEAVIRYASIRGLDRNLTLALEASIMSMDRAYRAWAADERGRGG